MSIFVSLRYSATVISTILVYCLLWAFLGPDQERIQPSDVLQFRNMGLISLGVGGLCTLIFHIIVKGGTRNQTQNDDQETGNLIYNGSGEPSSQESSNNRYDDEEIQCNSSGYQEIITEPNNDVVPSQHPLQRPHSIHEIMRIKDWLLEPQVYQVACVYMTARLFVNITQAYIPLYIQETLHLKAYFVALIPVIMYLSGFFVSVIIKPITVRIGRKFMFALACLIGVASCLLMNPGKYLSKNQYILIKTFSCILFCPKYVSMFQ